MRGLMLAMQEKGMWRKLLVLTLVTSLIHVSGVSTALMAKSLPGPEAIQQKVEGAGVGSYIALKLRDGKKLKGRLEAIEEKRFTVGLLQGEGAQLQVSYEEVAKIKRIKKTAYRAAGQPNPALAKQAIEGLGVGTHVMVKVLAGTVLRGHIQATHERTFSLRLDASSQPTPISYDQVLQVRKNPHVLILTTLFVAIGAIIGLLVYLAVRRPKARVQPIVKSIDPRIMRAGTSVDVRITGSKFSAGATVTFEKGDGPTPMASNVVVVDPNTITVTVTVESGGPPRNRVWDVVVTNADGETDRLADAFTVIPEARGV